jgi:hypothetical protein
LLELGDHIDSEGEDCALATIHELVHGAIVKLYVNDADLLGHEVRATGPEAGERIKDSRLVTPLMTRRLRA